MTSVDTVVYAGFWRRLAAALVDFAIAAPIAAIWYMFDRQGPALALYLIVPKLAFTAWYGMYLVARFGGTPGKLILGLRITMQDGSPVTPRAAVLRHIVDFAFAVVVTVVVALAVQKLPAATFYTLGFRERHAALEPFLPAWYDTLMLVAGVWLWGEMLVLLTNRKRRALHDFIAGTVVIVHGATRPSSTDHLAERTPLPRAS